MAHGRAWVVVGGWMERGREVGRWRVLEAV